MGLSMEIKGKNMYSKMRVEVFGALPEAMLNAAAFSGIELWNLERVGENSLSFEVYESCLEELEALADICSAELKIIKYSEEKRRVLKNDMPCCCLCSVQDCCCLFHLYLYGRLRCTATADSAGEKYCVLWRTAVSTSGASGRD